MYISIYIYIYICIQLLFQIAKKIDSDQYKNLNLFVPVVNLKGYKLSWIHQV